MAKVRVPVIPKMTANNSPAPFAVSVNFNLLGGSAADGFDGSASTILHSANGITTGTYTMDLGSMACAVDKLYIAPQGGWGGRCLKDFTVWGSNDATDWTLLNTVTGCTSWPDTGNSFTWGNTNSYRYYKVVCTANNGDSGYLTLSTMQLFKRVSTTGADDAYTKALFHFNGDEGSFAVIEETGKDVANYGACLTQYVEQNPGKGKTYYESGHYGGDVPANAFDGSLSTVWQGSGANSWLAVDMGAGNAKTITSFTLRPNTYGGNAQLKDFTVYGSNDSTNGSDGTWESLYTGQHANNGNLETYTIAFPAAYRWYKLLVTSSWRGDYGGASIFEWGMLPLDTFTPTFGSAMVNWTGANYLTVTNTAIAAGTADFTVDTVIIPFDKSTDRLFWDTRSSGGAGDGFWFGIHNGGIGLFTSGGWATYGGSITLGIKHHVMAVRQSGYLKLFLDGVQVGSTVALANSFTCQTAYVGRAVDGGYTFALQDELRYSVGIARQFDNFIPPTTEYAPTEASVSNAQVTQELVEALVLPSDSNVRTSQVIAEVAVFPADQNARIGQEVVEAVVLPSDSNIRVSHEVVEVAVLPDDQKSRVSQAVVEVVVLPGSSVSFATFI